MRREAVLVQSMCRQRPAALLLALLERTALPPQGVAQALLPPSPRTVPVAVAVLRKRRRRQPRQRWRRLGAAPCDVLRSPPPPPYRHRLPAAEQASTRVP